MMNKDGETTIVNPYYSPGSGHEYYTLATFDSLSEHHGIVVTNVPTESRVDLMVSGIPPYVDYLKKMGLSAIDDQVEIQTIRDRTQWVNLYPDALDNLILTLQYYRKKVYG